MKNIKYSKKLLTLLLAGSIALSTSSCTLKNNTNNKDNYYRYDDWHELQDKISELKKIEYDYYKSNPDKLQEDALMDETIIAETDYYYITKIIACGLVDEAYYDVDGNYVPKAVVFAAPDFQRIGDTGYGIKIGYISKDLVNYNDYSVTIKKKSR